MFKKAFMVSLLVSGFFPVYGSSEIDSNEGIEPSNDYIVDNELNRGWKVQTKKSKEDCVSISRDKRFRRIYYGIWYKKKKSSGWRMMVGPEVKIKYNEPIFRCKSNSYKLMVKVKYKKSNSYTIDFQGE